MGRKTEYQSQYYKEHKAERDAAHSAWVERNRDRVNAYLRAYRAKRKAQKGTEA